MHSKWKYHERSRNSVDAGLPFALEGARILKNTPRVLSVDRLVVKGMLLHWDLKDDASLSYGGLKIQLEVVMGVPLLPLDWNKNFKSFRW